MQLNSYKPTHGAELIDERVREILIQIERIFTKYVLDKHIP